jgi:hypothetical protein
MNNNPYTYLWVREVDCPGTSDESGITPAVVRMNLHEILGISESFLVVPGDAP